MLGGNALDHHCTAGGKREVARSRPAAHHRDTVMSNLFFFPTANYKHMIGQAVNSIKV